MIALVVRNSSREPFEDMVFPEQFKKLLVPVDEPAAEAIWGAWNNDQFR